MVAILKIRAVGARNLPVMNRNTKLTDAYVEIKFSDQEPQRTEICRDSLNPVWNEDFRIEVADEFRLQDEPLEISVWDHDVISSDDVIGTVSIDLNTLLQVKASHMIDIHSSSKHSKDGVSSSASASAPSSSASSALLISSSNLDPSLQSAGSGITKGGDDASKHHKNHKAGGKMEGWFPLYDNIEGIRGQIYIIVKLQLVDDVNPYRDASTGVLFLSSTMPPPEGMWISRTLGFVEDLIVESDPEHNWVDNFRSSRTSNDERQRLMFRLSGRVRRQVGRKAKELGANSIVGYHQHYDFDDINGITVRGYGTACIMTQYTVPSAASSSPAVVVEKPQRSVVSVTPVDQYGFLSVPVPVIIAPNMPTPQLSSSSISSSLSLSDPSSPSSPALSVPQAGASALHRIGSPQGSPTLYARTASNSARNSLSTTPISGSFLPSSASAVSSSSAAVAGQVLDQIALNDKMKNLKVGSNNKSKHKKSSKKSSSKKNKKRSKDSKDSKDAKKKSSSSSANANSKNHIIKMASASSPMPSLTMTFSGIPAATRGKSSSDIIGSSGQSSLLLSPSSSPSSLSSPLAVSSAQSGSVSDLLLPHTSSSASISKSKHRSHNNHSHNNHHHSTGAANAGSHHSKSRNSVTVMTLAGFPEGSILHLGGIVTARMVKLLSEPYKRETADEVDSWWSELREEIHGHARALHCTHVIGYTEYANVREDVLILSATGTAVIMASRVVKDLAPQPMHNHRHRHHHSKATSGVPSLSCKACHVPLPSNNSPQFQMRMQTCQLCHNGHVPEVLLSTSELLPELSVTGDGCLVEARICRIKPRLRGEALAQSISESLPFVEYDLHRQLLYKLKLFSFNAAFGIKVQLTIGEEHIVALASATGVFLHALPPPPSLEFKRTLGILDAEDVQMVARQKRLQEISEYNKKLHMQPPPTPQPMADDDESPRSVTSENESESDASSSSSSSSADSYSSNDSEDSSSSSRSSSSEEKSSSSAKKDSDSEESDSDSSASTSSSSSSSSSSSEDDRRHARSRKSRHSSSSSSSSSSRSRSPSSSSSSDSSSHSEKKRRRRRHHRSHRSPSSSDSSKRSSTSSSSSSDHSEEDSPSLSSSASESRSRSHSREDKRSRRHRSRSSSRSSASWSSSSSSSSSDDDKKRSKRSKKDRRRHRSSSSSSSSSTSDSHDNSSSDHSHPEEQDEDGQQHQQLQKRGVSQQQQKPDVSQKRTHKQHQQHQQHQQQQQQQQQQEQQQKSSYIVEIDDETDEDIMAVLLESIPPRGITFHATKLPPARVITSDVQHLFILRRYTLNAPQRKLNQQLAAIFQDVYSYLIFKLSGLAPCDVCGLRSEIKMTGEEELQIAVNAMVVISRDPNAAATIYNKSQQSSASSAPRRASDLFSGHHIDQHQQQQHITVLPALHQIPPPLALPSRFPQPAASFGGSREASLLANSSSIVPSSNNDPIIVSAASAPHSAHQSPVSSKRISMGQPPLFPVLAAPSIPPPAFDSSFSSSGSSSNTPSPMASPAHASVSLPASGRSHGTPQEADEMIFPMDGVTAGHHHSAPSARNSWANPHHPRKHSQSQKPLPHLFAEGRDWTRSLIVLSPLCTVHNAQIDHQLGHLTLHFVRESWEVTRESGGVGAFFHAFLTQAQAVVRSHVSALGGNALLNYRVDQHVILENAKNQAYSLITIRGDVVSCRYTSASEGHHRLLQLSLCSDAR